MNKICECGKEVSEDNIHVCELFFLPKEEEMGLITLRSKQKRPVLSKVFGYIRIILFKLQDRIYNK